MDVVGDLGNPQKDAAAFAPVIQGFETNLAKDLTTEVIPALIAALGQLLDGRKVTITVSVELKNQVAAGSSS
jgi:hypothetical protein